MRVVGSSVKAVLVGVVALVGSSSCTGSSTDDVVSTTTTTSMPEAAPVCTGADAGAGPVTEAYRRIDGVDPDLLSVDVYPLDGNCEAPVVIWVHGGGYQIGDKSQQVADKIRLAEQRGWVLVSANYRLTDPDDPASARFPDHYEDVAAAIAWVKDEIDGFGGDPDRVAVLGHSAGADIVANVTTNPTYLATFGRDLDDVTCAGVFDTAGFDKAARPAEANERVQWEQALGNEPDYLVRTSATRLVRPGIGIPATIGVYRGTPARQAIEKGYLAALEAAGVATVSIDARSLSHAEVTRRIGADGDTVMTPPLVDFLDGCFEATPAAG